MRSLWIGVREAALRFRPRFARILPLVLAATVAANLAATPFIPAQSQPVLTHPAGDLVTIVRTDQWSVDIRYRFYLDLYEIAAGGVLVIPPGTFIEPLTARGLSDVTVEIVEYDPVVGPEISGLDRMLIGRVVVGDRGVPYWLVGGAPATTFWYAETGRDVLIVPESVAPAPRGASDG